jgi:hypothetical protein
MFVWLQPNMKLFVVLGNSELFLLILLNRVEDFFFSCDLFGFNFF